MNFEKVIRGIIKYINAEMYHNMTEWQEFVARLAVARMTSNPQVLKKSLMDNALIKTFAIFDEEENVDIEGLLRDLKHVIESKGKVSFEIAELGKFTFVPDDVDKLHRYIMEA